MKPQLIDVLKLFQKRIPKDSHSRGAIRYSLDEAAVRSNLEIIYRSSTGRLAQLAYFVDSSLAVGKMEDFKPSIEAEASSDFQIAFNDYDTMPEKLAQSFNQQMGEWACNVVMRELCEYLHYYLLQVYETCLTMKLAGQDIKLDKIDEIQAISEQFEKKGLPERFQILNKEFDIDVNFRHELASLYEARHIFAHFDGYVQKKFCNNQGVVVLTWPKNKYQLVKRKDGKKIAYHRVPRPIDPKVYSDFTITYFGKSVQKKYAVGHRIALSAQDIQDLLFLFIHTFDHLQGRIVQFAQRHHLNVRDFKDYQIGMSLMAQAVPASLMDRP